MYNFMVTYCKLYYQHNGELPSKFDLIKFSTRIWERMP